MFGPDPKFPTSEFKRIGFSILPEFLSILRSPAPAAPATAVIERDLNLLFVCNLALTIVGRSGILARPELWSN